MFEVTFDLLNSIPSQLLKPNESILDRYNSLPPQCLLLFQKQEELHEWTENMDLYSSDELYRWINRWDSLSDFPNLIAKEVSQLNLSFQNPFRIRYGTMIAVRASAIPNIPKYD